MLRRALSVPGYLALAGLVLALAPLTLPVAAVVDLASRWTTAALRCTAFLTLYLLCEAAGILAAAGVWLLSGVWLPGGDAGARRERFLGWNFALECWWASALFFGAARVFGFRLEVENAEAVERGPLLLFIRHASTADTLLAAILVSARHGIRLRYVLKRELLWDPCLDIVGNRLPNYFVDRQAEDGAREIAAVAALAEGLGPDEGVLIYPEGTRFSEVKRTRVLARLRAQAGVADSPAGEDALLAHAEALEHVLPPRLGGPLGLLERSPGADVVFCAHTGFECAATLLDLWHGSLVGQVIRVRFWRVARAEIPASHDARAEWLLEHWRRVDAWIGATAKPRGEPPPASQARSRPRRPK